MKRLLPIFLLVSAACVSAQAPQMPQGANIPTNLKPYFLALLVHGANWTPGDSPEAKLLMPAHLAFVREQVENHKILLAGPLLDEGNTVGYGIVAAGSGEEAKAILSGDPEIKSGRLAVELHPILAPDLSNVKVEFPAAAVHQ